MGMPMMQVRRMGVGVGERRMFMRVGMGDRPRGSIQAGMDVLVMRIAGVGMGVGMIHQEMGMQMGVAFANHQPCTQDHQR